MQVAGTGTGTGQEYYTCGPPNPCCRLILYIMWPPMTRLAFVPQRTMHIWLPHPCSIIIAHMVSPSATDYNAHMVHPFTHYHPMSYVKSHTGYLYLYKPTGIYPHGYGYWRAQWYVQEYLCHCLVITSLHPTINLWSCQLYLGVTSIISAYLAHFADVTRCSIVPHFTFPDL